MLSKKISKSLPSDPLKVLFIAHIQDEDSDSFASKTAIIQQFTHELEELECNCENQATFLHWASIFSGFSGCLALTATTTLNPLLGLFVAASATSSAGVVISGSYFRHQKMSETSKKLQRYTIALKSTAGSNWAKLWQVVGLDLFLECLVSASKGHIDHQGNLVRHDGRNALAVAVDYCAERLGITRTELLERATAAVAALPSQTQDTTPTPTKLLQNAPTVLQTPTPTPTPTPGYAQDYEQNAVSIIDTLVLQADKKTLGGLVIIAAPGAGKTTFLGTAWGRLKNFYGNRLNTLAIVVKRSDTAFFKAYADKAYCVKDSAVNVAIEIIKFIDAGMKPGKITRVFLDDFLTMNVMFENSLRGVYIEPHSLCIQDKKEEGSVSLLGHLHATLNEAWLVGREYNLCLWASTHSSNITDLPWCTSSSVRTLGTFIFLAKNGNREFLELALNNNFLISDNNKRPMLKKQLDALDSGDSPIVLSNSNNWQLGLVPEFIYDEYQGYRNTVTVEAETVEGEEDNAPTLTDKQRLETLFQLETTTDATPINKVKLSAMAQKLLEFLTRTERVEADVREFKGNFKVNGDRFNVEQLKEWMNEIVAAKVAETIDENIIKIKQS